MPFESYQPGKESREIERAQREQAAGQEVRLGFARSHTETAKPMDTLKGMIKRAYKEGKLYSEKQASEAAGEVVEKLQTEASKKGIDKIRINPGDRITFRNDSIILSQFDRKEGGFVDTKIDPRELEGEGSINHREREIVGAAQVARADLSEEVAETREKGKRPENPTEDWEGKESGEVRLEREASRRARATQETDKSTVQQPKTPEVRRTKEQERLARFNDLLSNREELQQWIRKDQSEKVKLVVLKTAHSKIPPQYSQYQFSEVIVVRGDNREQHYLIGIDAKKGEIALFEAKKTDEVKVIKPKDFRNLAEVMIALDRIANPSTKE